jgi:hypothetical protein
LRKRELIRHSADKKNGNKQSGLSEEISTGLPFVISEYLSNAA